MLAALLPMKDQYRHLILAATSRRATVNSVFIALARQRLNLYQSKVFSVIITVYVPSLCVTVFHMRYIRM